MEVCRWSMERGLSPHWRLRSQLVVRLFLLLVWQLRVSKAAELGLLRQSRLSCSLECFLSARVSMMKELVASWRLSPAMMWGFGLVGLVVGLGSLLGLEISMVFRRKSWVCYGPLGLDRRPGI